MRFWAEHLAGVEREWLSLKAYAGKRDLPIKTIYHWSITLKKLAASNRPQWIASLLRCAQAYGVGAPTNAGSGEVQEAPFIGDDDIGEENKPRGYPPRNERNMRAAKSEE